MNRLLKMRAEHALKILKEIIDKNGARVSGTKSNESAVDQIKQIIASKGLSVFTESFTIYPQALFAIGKVFSIIYGASLICLLMNSIIFKMLSVLILALGVLFFLMQLILYLPFFDKLFPKRNARNIISILEPENTPEKQIIIVGHHDSSPIYTYYEKYTQLFSIRLILAIFFYFYSLCISVMSVFMHPTHNLLMLLIAVLGLLFVIPMFFYISKNGSPGAGDNLIGCTIGIEILDLLREYELKGTKIILLLTDGEEAGQKGAVDYIKKHYLEMQRVMTEVINIDTIYKKEDIQILLSDRNGITKLDKKMAMQMERIAIANEIPIQLHSMPFLGGGTDGGQFARKGIKTMSLIGLPISFFRNEILMHTYNDVASKIEIEAIESVINIIISYIVTENKLEKKYV